MHHEVTKTAVFPQQLCIFLGKDTRSTRGRRRGNEHAEEFDVPVGTSGNLYAVEYCDALEDILDITVGETDIS